MDLDVLERRAGGLQQPGARHWCWHHWKLLPAYGFAYLGKQSYDKVQKGPFRLIGLFTTEGGWGQGTYQRSTKIFMVSRRGRIRLIGLKWDIGGKGQLKGRFFNTFLTLSDLSSVGNLGHTNPSQNLSDYAPQRERQH